MDSTIIGTGVPPAPPSLSRATPQFRACLFRADDIKAEHECMTVCELASWLRVTRKTVYEYAARNAITCRRLGRRLVFSRPAVAAWLARSSMVSAPGAFASGRR